MNLPGFTAEASIYRSNGHYQLKISSRYAVPGQINPMMIGRNIDGNGLGSGGAGCMSSCVSDCVGAAGTDACIRQCSRMCFPTGKSVGHVGYQYNCDDCPLWLDIILPGSCDTYRAFCYNQAKVQPGQ